MAQTMLDAFKIKPYDLEPVFASWKNGPRFTGNPKKDPPVDEWLKQIKAGCIERNIPQEYWYKVAQHFMGPKAKARLDELKSVISKVHGGKYRWTWKKFKIAVRNMGWGIDPAQTETIKVHGKGSGLWWMMRRKEDKDVPDADADVPQRPIPSRSDSSFWGSKKTIKDENDAPHPHAPSRSNSLFWTAKKGTKDETDTPPRPTPSRSGTDIFWPVRRNSKDESEDSSASQRPGPLKTKSDTAVVTARGTPKPPTPSRSNTAETMAVATVTQAPTWLLNACNALDYITSEHPKAMSVISAILITAGSLPAIPAISAGAGGAILASGAAHAIGAIAVGLGQALNSTVKNQHEGQAEATTTVR